MTDLPKPVVWVASSLEDLKASPRAVQRVLGQALQEAQFGRKPVDAKPLKGFNGAGVLEIVEDHDGNTYRAVYTVRLADRVYVLHAFQKKSKRGIKTPKHVIDLINARLKQAERIHAELVRRVMSDERDYTIGSGNVFADLGLPDAEELKAKSDLVIEIAQIIEERGLKQAEAAHIMGIDQPKVSALVRGKLDGFSMERLYRFLNALDRDVEIVVSPKPESREQGTLSVTRKSGRSRVRRETNA